MPDRHDLPEDAPALFEAALATLPPGMAVLPEQRGRHPGLQRIALAPLLGPDAEIFRAIRLARRAADAARLPSDLARPWRQSALLSLARPDAHRCTMLLALLATPLGLVGWTNTGMTESSLRLRARPGASGAAGPPAAIAALRHLLAQDPPDALRLPPPQSRHARLADAALFGPEGRGALGAEGRPLFLRRQHGLAALGILDARWEPRILALATDP